MSETANYLKVPAYRPHGLEVRAEAHRGFVGFSRAMRNPVAPVTSRVTEA